MAPVHLPVLPSVRGSLHADGTRERIITADVRGRFHRARTVVFAFLLVVPLVLPWIEIGGRPAVWLDIPRRRFYLLGGTFNAQDTWLFLLLLLAIGLALMAATVVAGRVLCGWFCPQTVLLDGIIRPLERLLLGSRDDRRRRDRHAGRRERVVRAAVAHAAYAAVALLLAHLAAALFVTPRELLTMVRRGPRSSPEAFAWVASLALLIYLDASWFREQLCLIVCPYGRLQSLLLDAHSLVVGYDERRGEPRGKASDPQAGDCVDCGRCVAVCPTGIDIRDGLQVDCIACTACIDACDEIMDRLDRPRGLIRYTSQAALEAKPTRVARARSVAYVALALTSAAALAWAVVSHDDFEARLAHLPGAPYAVDQERVRDSFEVVVVNKRAEPATFEIVPAVPGGVDLLVPMHEVRVEALGMVRVPLFATEPRSQFREPFPITVLVEREGAAEDHKALTATFLGPEP